MGVVSADRPRNVVASEVPENQLIGGRGGNRPALAVVLKPVPVA